MLDLRVAPYVEIKTELLKETKSQTTRKAECCGQMYCSWSDARFCRYCGKPLVYKNIVIDVPRGMKKVEQDPKNPHAYFDIPAEPGTGADNVVVFYKSSDPSNSYMITSHSDMAINLMDPQKISDAIEEFKVTQEVMLKDLADIIGQEPEIKYGVIIIT